MTDKQMHFFTGYFIATVLPIPIWYGLLLCLIAAVAKEVWDSQGHGTPDVMDALATMAGGIVGIFSIMWRGL